MNGVNKQRKYIFFSFFLSFFLSFFKEERRERKKNQDLIIFNFYL